jgi:hypothetical protein
MTIQRKQKFQIYAKVRKGFSETMALKFMNQSNENLSFYFLLPVT